MRIGIIVNTWETKDYVLFGNQTEKEYLNNIAELILKHDKHNEIIIYNNEDFDKGLINYFKGLEERRECGMYICLSLMNGPDDLASQEIMGYYRIGGRYKVMTKHIVNNLCKKFFIYKNKGVRIVSDLCNRNGVPVYVLDDCIALDLFITNIKKVNFKGKEESLARNIVKSLKYVQ